eukprot:gene10119-13601_t
MENPSIDEIINATANLNVDNIIVTLDESSAPEQPIDATIQNTSEIGSSDVNTVAEEMQLLPVATNGQIDGILQNIDHINNDSTQELLSSNHIKSVDNNSFNSALLDDISPFEDNSFNHISNNDFINNSSYNNNHQLLNEDNNQQHLVNQSNIINQSNQLVRHLSDNIMNELTPSLNHQMEDQFENTKVFGNKSLDELHRIQSRQSHLSAGIPFSDPLLKIPRPILHSLTVEMRFEKPSHIQAAAIPIILDGHNLIAQAQSGAGKTIAFAIGMLSRIDPSIPRVQALCLTPTRELANQIIRSAIFPLSTNLPGVTCEEALAGSNTNGSTCSAHIVVGTPGTVSRWVKKGYLNPMSIKIFAVDEADKMVSDKSLGAETKLIRNKLHPRCQILFFSATYAAEVLAYAKTLVPRAYVIKPRSTEELVLDVIFQLRMDVRNFPGGKLQVLKDIYEVMTLGGQSIVFVEMKRDVDAIAAMMRESGFEVSPLHADLTGEDRDRVMNDFIQGYSNVLITTNVLARGVDVPAVQMVVNYDLPVKRLGNRIQADEETYLHRIGRSGRFGRKGTAVTFLEKAEDFKLLEEIEHYFSPNKRITTEWSPFHINELKNAISERPEDMQIGLEALNGSSGAANTVTIHELIG